MNADNFTDFIHSGFNNTLNIQFSYFLITDINVFKKGDRNSKDNHSPVSILTNISKTFEIYVSTNLQFYGTISIKISMWI